MNSCRDLIDCGFRKWQMVLTFEDRGFTLADVMVCPRNLIEGQPKRPLAGWRIRP